MSPWMILTDINIRTGTKITNANIYIPINQTLTSNTNIEIIKSYKVIIILEFHVTFAASTFLGPDADLNQ